MRNIHMMMPPTYRDLWKGEFQDIKKQDVAAGMGWMYEADPFVAQKNEKRPSPMPRRRDKRWRRKERRKRMLVPPVLGVRILLETAATA